MPDPPWPLPRPNATFFCTLFGDALKPHAVTSIGTAQHLGQLHIATPDTAHNLRVSVTEQRFAHVVLHSLPLPAGTLRWEKMMEWLKAAFVAAHLVDGILVYVELDMLFPPESKKLFITAAREMQPFDVAYTLRSDEHDWGTVNSGVVLYNATAAARDWAAAIARDPSKDKQIVVDRALYASSGAPKLPLWVWPMHTRVVDSATGARVVTMPLQPLNVLNAPCDEPGVLHMHGPSKPKVLQCCNLTHTAMGTPGVSCIRRRRQARMLPWTHIPEGRAYSSVVRAGGTGYCNVTESKPSNCHRDSSGSWQLPSRSLCHRRCMQCQGCRFISYSSRYRDCSWFTDCNLDNLQNTVPGFYTEELRKENRVLLSFRRRT